MRFLSPDNLLITTLVLLMDYPANVTDYKVFYLGGRSNMDGFGYVKDLNPEDTAPVKGVIVLNNEGRSANINRLPCVVGKLVLM